MEQTKQQLQEAVKLHQTGHLEAASKIYQEILQSDPDQADAHHLYGVIRHQQGDHEGALESIQRALDIRGPQPFFLNNIGEVYRKLGRLAEARDRYEEAVKLAPNYATCHNNLGSMLYQLGHFEEAKASFERAIEIKPDFADAVGNLGTAMYHLGDCEAAIKHYRSALELKPDHAEAHNNLGSVLAELGHLDEALMRYQRAVELDPNYAEALANVGNVLSARGKPTEAAEYYRRALKLRGGDAEIHTKMGRALSEQGRISEGIAFHEEAAKLNPDLADPFNGLGNSLAKQGRLEEALEAFRRAVELNPEIPLYHSNLLRCEQYRLGVTAAALLDLHLAWDERHAVPLRDSWPEHPNEPDPERPLQLGVVSTYFRRHPAGYLSIRALEAMDREQVSMHLYSSSDQTDDLTPRFQALGAWENLSHVQNEEFVRRICEDKIDVLINLSGTDRLMVFAHKPAPIQITWLGYVGTTGMQAMDYLLADPYHVPVGEEKYYRERIMRLPRAYACYDGLPVEPAESMPASENGFITFGGSHNLAKLNPVVLETWSKILHRVPGSRLRLKYSGLGETSVQQRFYDMFAGYGIDAGRVQLEGKSPKMELLEWYKQIDVALDPFPYSGGITTCDALWMGVPVISMPGETFAGRHSWCYLNNAGLTDLTAGNLEEYVEKAVALASDPERLAELRNGLRERVEQRLCDGQKLADELLAAIRQAWREWCATAANQIQT